MTQTGEADLLDRMLQLERSLGAYRRLHAEELDELERRLVELKSEMLTSHRMGTTKSESDWQS
ncbi:MAG: hypothetical protein M5U01_33695 [Ardenticatenaceae bacterium]|nr:hypothetical protein [Ardenticatenaceae bacterium]